MSIFFSSKLQAAIGDIRRFRTVVTVLFEEGFSYLVDETSLRYLVPLRARFLSRVKVGAEAGGRVLGLKIREVPPEVRLRRAMERLGPTFMKLGQMLSVRTDIMPAEYVAELAKLQDRGPTLSPGVAEKIVEDELGMPVENIFRHFDVQPIAAASLAQVHKAVLRDGTPVAVKVRRPGIEETIRTDIHILAYLAQLLEKHVPASRKLRPVRVVREFADWTLRELNFELEGAHLDMFRENLSPMPNVVIPKVYWDATGQSVLVTDFLEGIKVDNLDEIDRHGVDRHELARIGLQAGVRMFLVDGFFHADPHPGNLVVMPAVRGQDGEEVLPLRLGMYDFGMVGRISERHRYELISCLASFVEQDSENYIKHVLDLAEREEGADVRSFESDVQNILVAIMHVPLERKGIAQALYRVLASGAKYGILFPAELVLLAKAFVTVERFGLRMWPDLDPVEELRPFLADIIRREFSPNRLLADMKTSAFDNLYFLRHLPEQTQVLLQRFDRGEIGVKLDLQELRDLKEEFDRQNDVRVLSVLAAALLIASAAVLRLDVRAAAVGIPLGRIGFIVAVAVVAWLFMLIRKRP